MGPPVALETEGKHSQDCWLLWLSLQEATNVHGGCHIHSCDPSRQGSDSIAWVTSYYEVLSCNTSLECEKLQEAGPSGWVSSYQGQGLSRHHGEGHIPQGLPPARSSGHGQQTCYTPSVPFYHQSYYWALPLPCFGSLPR